MGLLPRSGPSMPPAEVLRAREVLGLTPEGLAAHLAVTGGEVRGWEAGSLRVPGRHARQLAWDAAVREREDALAASGLAECEWMTRHDAVVDALHRDTSGSVAEMEAHAAEYEAHMLSCEICRAREEFEVSRFGPMPEVPMDLGSRFLVGFISFVDGLPRWVRPAVYGAVVAGAMVLVRVVLALLVRGPSPELLATAASGLAAGAYLGLVGGVTFSVVREPFRRLGRAGDYLTGIACVTAYLLAFFVPMALFSHAPEFRDLVMWIIAAVMCLCFGLMIGHSWFRSADPAPREQGG